MAWKEYCAEYWLKELQESMDRCTGCCDITEILMKMALNTIQSINQSHLMIVIKAVCNEVYKQSRSEVRPYWNCSLILVYTLFAKHSKLLEFVVVLIGQEISKSCTSSFKYNHEGQKFSTLKASEQEGLTRAIFTEISLNIHQ